MPHLTPVDPDRDEARRWLEEELRAGDYQLGESLVVRAWRWLTDRLPDLGLSGQLPAGAAWALLAVVLVAAAAVVAFAARDRWRRGALGGSDRRGAVLEESGTSAAGYRARARAAAREGDHDGALLNAYRAIAAGAVERALVDGRPGRTAHEVSVALAPLFPAEAEQLAGAAASFDAVRYGGARAVASTAEGVLELERRISTARPAPAATPPTPGGPA